MRNFWFAVQKEGCGAHRSGLELDVVQHGVFLVAGCLRQVPVYS